VNVVLAAERVCAVPRDLPPYRTTFWSDGDRPAIAPLSKDIDADVAIVGGGFVGLSSACALTKADPSLRVVVTEAEHVGFGSSGRGSGMVAPFLHSIGIVARIYGWDEARWAARCLVDQAGILRDFIRNESIACDYRDGPVIMAAVNDGQAEWLKHRAHELSLGGYTLEFLGAKRRRHLLNYPTRAGIEIQDANFGQLQPFALANGFATAARRNGVQLFEKTTIQRYISSPKKIELVTREGARITAQKLVLAPGAGIRKLGWGRARLFPILVHSYLLATEPLERAVLENLGSALAHASVLDASPSFYYLRTYQDRLVIGGAGAMLSKGDEAADRDINRYRMVLAELHKRFPFLKDTPVAAAWAGPIQSNPTELPIARELPDSPNVVLNIAYVNGVPLSHLAGQLVVGLVLGTSYSDPDAERLRKIFNQTSPSLGELVKFGWALVR